MVDGNSRWEARIRECRPIFEVAGFALTTVTWSSLCIVVSYLFIRGYWTPAPALQAMGWQGTFLYCALALAVVVISFISSGALIVTLWSLVLDLKYDLEFGSNKVVAFLVSLFSGLWHHAFGMFILMLIVILSVQVISAIDGASIGQRNAANATQMQHHEPSD
ncbi:hypothetical protein ACS5UA_12970 [Brucella sp. RRSP16]|uniref:hypothetical protein n=1 Tax=Brucella sp. RRSP16 TaxID=3453707 RepID=UPI003FCD0395